MTKIKIAGISLAVVSATVVTVVLVANINTTSYNSDNTIQGAPYQVNTFLDESDIQALKDQDMKIYPGFTPPLANGTYTIDNWTVKYDKLDVLPVGKAISKCNYVISDQNQDGRINVSYTCEGQDSGTGTGGYISGSGDCFTMYLDQKGQTAECVYSSPALVSACVDTNGLKGLQYSLLMKSRDESKKCDDYLMTTGNLRIISIDDDYAERINGNSVPD